MSTDASKDDKGPTRSRDASDLARYLAALEAPGYVWMWAESDRPLSRRNLTEVVDRCRGLIKARTARSRCEQALSCSLWGERPDLRILEEALLSEDHRRRATAASFAMGLPDQLNPELQDLAERMATRSENS